MADQINMNGLNLGAESAAASQARSYIPPHMRGRQGAAPAPAAPAPAINGNSQPPVNGVNGTPPPSTVVLTTALGLLGIQTANNFPAGGRQGGGNWGGDAPAFSNNNTAGGNRRGGGGWGGRGGYSGGYEGHGNGGGGGGGGGGTNIARGSGDGRWQDGKHIAGPANPRTERELFGTADDPSKQHTGINFEKYDDIPVEASGRDVPEPVHQFTNPL
ncbi:ATP-dependent RNA helicase DED1 [Cladobotryum mycophilum]|uniref:ATP-dependent RNA helicase DED1 n=1 Tax=Cladobotryum mycophilum TaxID=491253 RepID=A0ABR0SNS5_9HYPO